VNPAERSPYDVWRELAASTAATWPQGIFECFAAGSWPAATPWWYGTLDAVSDGRLDPLPAVGKAIGLDEVPEALDQLRKGQGPPRVVVHPGA
jgi:threonine dehydrogenase-like Zn-dependent dehydrogenase